MSVAGDNLKTNPTRLWDSLMEMAKIGPGIAGGNNRQTLTDEDSEGRHLFQRWCEAAGMTLAVEPILNAGSKACRTLKDRWTVVTKDGSLSAQWEHTIVVTSDGCEILTDRGD